MGQRGGFRRVRFCRQGAVTAGRSPSPALPMHRLHFSDPRQKNHSPLGRANLSGGRDIEQARYVKRRNPRSQILVQELASDQSRPVTPNVSYRGLTQRPRPRARQHLHALQKFLTTGILLISSSVSSDRSSQFVPVGRDFRLERYSSMPSRCVCIERNGWRPALNDSTHTGLPRTRGSPPGQLLCD